MLVVDFKTHEAHIIHIKSQTLDNILKPKKKIKSRAKVEERIVRDIPRRKAWGN